MKSVKNFISIITALILVVTMVFAQPIQVQAATVGADMYAQRATEELVIDGVTYTFNYFYENGNRVITIANSENINVEKVSYNPESETMSWYKSVRGNDEVNAISSEWVFVNRKTHTVNWGESTNSAIAAAAIAVYLGTLGAAGVVAAMGVGALGALAASAKGGTLTVDMYYMIVPLQGTQFLYVWNFTADTGEHYGPYQYIDYPDVLS